MTTTSQVAAVQTIRPGLASRLGIGRGALAVAVGTIVSGLTAYAFLIVTARQLGPVQYSALSALWTLVFLVGPGVFSPLEQEVCRAAAARCAVNDGDRPPVVRGAQVGAVMLVALLVVVAACTLTLRARLFEDDIVLVFGLALGLTGYYWMHLGWGVLASRRHFRGYAVTAGSEGTVRLLICLGLLAVGVRSLGAYGIALGVAPFAAAYAGWRSEPVSLVDGSPEPWQLTARAIAYLVGASALKQIVLMVGPIAVQVLASSGERNLAGRYLAALALTRVPLFLFNAVLVALLPRLSQLATEGRRGEFTSVLQRLSLGLAFWVAAAAAVAAAAGPAILRLFFGGAYTLPASDLVTLTIGCGFYMLALVLSYGLIAMDGHKWTTVSWAAGCAAFAVLVGCGSDLGLIGRVQWGFFGASATAAISMAALLVRAHRRHHRWFAHAEELIGEPAG
jgi:O-antigen/teichoic acid export membrane protein